MVSSSRSEQSQDTNKYSGEHIGWEIAGPSDLMHSSAIGCLRNSWLETAGLRIWHGGFAPRAEKPFRCFVLEGSNVSSSQTDSPELPREL